MTQQLEKREIILEAAIRRFAHFGLHKTTLTEIADDLGMTKQAIAYYYPDKQALFSAVETKIIEEFFETIAAHFAVAAGTSQALMELVEVKQAFFEKYALLIRATGPEIIKNPDRLTESRQQVRSRLLSVIDKQLQHGIELGELKAMNTAEVAEILFDTISAFEYCAVGRQAVPDPQTFAALSTRQKAVLELIVAGLKTETWKQ